MDSSSRFGLLMIFGLALVAGAVSIGCSSNSRSMPDDISSDVLARALAESHLAAARASETGESLDSLRIVALDRIGIDTLAFNRAMEDIARNPDAFVSLYETAIDLLQQERGEFPSINQPESDSD